MACEQAHIWPAELCRCCYGNYSNNVRVQWKSFTAFLRCVLSRAIERGTVSRHFTNDLLNTRRLFIHHKRSIYYQNTQAIWLTACVNFTIDVTGVSTSSSYIEFSGLYTAHAHGALAARCDLRHVYIIYLTKLIIGVEFGSRRKAYVIQTTNNITVNTCD